MSEIEKTGQERFRSGVAMMIRRRAESMIFPRQQGQTGRCRKGRVRLKQNVNVRVRLFNQPANSREALREETASSFPRFPQPLPHKGMLSSIKKASRRDLSRVRYDQSGRAGEESSRTREGEDVSAVRRCDDARATGTQREAKRETRRDLPVHALAFGSLPRVVASLPLLISASPLPQHPLARRAGNTDGDRGLFPSEHEVRP